MPLVARIHGTDVDGQVFIFGKVMKGSENQDVWMQIVNAGEEPLTNVEISNPTQLALDQNEIPGLDPGADAWVMITNDTSHEPAEQGGELSIDWDGAAEPIVFTVNWELLPQETIEVPVEVPGPTVVKRAISSGQPMRYDPRTGEIK